MSVAAAPAAEAPAILREDADGVATLLLNRPAAYNALSTGLMTALQATLDAIAADASIHVVVIAGAGKGFCAGHDLRELRSRSSRGEFKAVFEQCSRLMQAIVALPKPVIARVHGVATAAGCQLVASCDLAVAARSARFGTPGVDIGLFCSTPMVALTRAVPRKRAMRMLLTGEMLDAEDAERFGLASHVVPDDLLVAETARVAQHVASKSPLTLKLGKAAFYRQAEMDLASAYAHASEVMTANMLARDAAIGIDAFINKTQPVWCGR
ncbi:MAG: enoyl-CoA hydratase [Alphaproteobacteria bacterium]|nr:enoyl-CoA hydratase [Alphaproteobacteria bacterium]